MHFQTKRPAIFKSACVLLPLLILTAQTHSTWAGEGYEYEEGTIWRAAQEGKIVNVKKMLGAKPSLLKQRDPRYHDTLLEAAAHGGNAVVFKYLVSRGAPVTINQIMLHAAAGGNMEIIRFVAAKGAKVNVRQPQSKDTPLMWAAEDHAKIDVLTFLVAHGADVNARSRGGFTPLIYAASFYRGTIRYPGIKFLVSKGASLEAQTIAKETCLSDSAQVGGYMSTAELSDRFSSAQFLLQKAKNTQSHSLWTSSERPHDQYGSKPVSARMVLRHAFFDSALKI